MWELLFLMVILKIPVLYLCAVVWWAIRAEPRPPEPAVVPARFDGPWPDRPRARSRRAPRRFGPHGSPGRSYPRTARAALARAEVRR